MGRDLLYKPEVPVPLPEDEGSKSTSRSTPVKGRAKDLGHVADAPPKPAVETGPAKAYKAAYFNKDTSGVGDVNLRQTNLAALRGGEEATNLRKVVLPKAYGVDTPDPKVLYGTATRMGLVGPEQREQPDLAGLLNRQAAWTKSEGMTAEKIQARLAELERMVSARIAALARMRAQSSPTIAQAQTMRGNATEAVSDVAAAGGALISETSTRAESMHRRLAKALGIKRSV